MRYPEFLKSQGRIGFVAPSFGCATEPYISRLDSALQMFTDMGYQTIIGPNCRADQGIGKSNTPEKCGAEINDFFINNRSDIILSCGGGETMCEDLPFIDFTAISKAKPKWYVGYSDNTNLTFTLPTLADTAAVYAPCATSFGAKPLHPSLLDTLSFLKGEKLQFKNYPLWERFEDGNELDPLASYCCTEPFQMKSFVPQGENLVEYAGKVSFSGRLIGGCLDCLRNICGTRFDKAAAFAQRYADDQIVWFLEACDLNPMQIRLALWQLAEAGWFSNVSGFLIGRALHYDAVMFGQDRVSAVTSVLERFKVPVLLDIDLGHLPPMMPMVSGACADISAADNSLTITTRLE